MKKLRNIVIFLLIMTLVWFGANKLFPGMFPYPGHKPYYPTPPAVEETTPEETPEPVEEPVEAPVEEPEAEAMQPEYYTPLQKTAYELPYQIKDGTEAIAVVEVKILETTDGIKDGYKNVALSVEEKSVPEGYYVMVVPFDTESEEVIFPGTSTIGEYSIESSASSTGSNSNLNVNLLIVPVEFNSGAFALFLTENNNINDYRLSDTVPLSQMGNKYYVFAVSSLEQ